MDEEIIRRILESLLDELKIDVDEDVKDRLTEGLMYSIRVLALLSIMRANDFWRRLNGFFPTRLGKRWFPVRTTDVQDVMQKDLLWLLRR